MFELLVLGGFVGFLSGFFGIGGGTILVPLLLFLEYDIKAAIGISVVQMVFSSIYGSYLNLKKGSLDVKMVSIIGFGGFVGAFFSGLIVANVSGFTLQIVFLSFSIFALLRLFFQVKAKGEEKKSHPITLLIMGFVIGILGTSIGVGGSILLVPILVAYFNVKLAKATSASLFFVMYSSISGFISQSYHENIDYHTGFIIGIASLLGVYFGIIMKHKTSETLQRRTLVLFYVGIVAYLIYKTFFAQG